MVNVRTKTAVGWDCTEPASNVSDNAGVYVTTLQVQLSHCCGCYGLEQLRKDPIAGGSGEVFSSNISRGNKGRFRKRVVLANVPSFRFLVPGNIRMYLRSVFGIGEHPNVLSFRFLVPGNIRQNHPFGNHPCANPNIGPSHEAPIVY